MGELLRAEDMEERTKGRVKARTWLWWGRQERIPTVNLGRRVFFREEDFERFIAAHVGGAIASVKPAAPRNGRRKAHRKEVRLSPSV